MKVLKFHEGAEEDYLYLGFKSTFDSRKTLEEELSPFLLTLESRADGWMPNVVDGKRRRKYSRDSFWKALNERRDGNSTALGFYRTEWPRLDMPVWFWLPPQPPEWDVSIYVKPLTFFTQAERCHHLVEMVREWALHYPVIHASAHSAADSNLADAPNFGRDMQTAIRDGFDRVYELSWLNVFSAKLVEAVGRERVLSTPAHRVEELPDGAVLLVTWPTVADFASEPARRAQARAYAHLRPDLDPDTVLRTLRERSAALAPVPPRFHPDVAPLLSRRVDRTPFHERQRRIAEFNTWRPPEPEEWMPACDAPTSDVADQERALKVYRFTAEHLVALMHTKVPSVFDATPESLTDVDHQLWLDDFPRSYARDKVDDYLVPALGAYLGGVLVRHLGGQWVPRQKLLETQVRVGARVWLPFARAWRALRTADSLLDCSLTQLYRVAERHRQDTAGSGPEA